MQQRKFEDEITLEPHLLDRLYKIDWFTQCGEPMTIAVDLPFRMAASWNEAIRYQSHASWEGATLEARNALSGYLFSFHREEFNRLWNPIAAQGRAFLEREIVPKITAKLESQAIDSVILDSVKWDVLGAIHETMFLPYRIPITFYLELLKVYELGHFPCGWENGKWPNGNLIIY